MTTVTQVGDTTFLANYLINTKVYAVVVPPGNNDQEFIATFEVQGDQGTLTMAAIIGPRGPHGIDMFVLSLQTDALADPSELPQTLTNTEADQGKFWVFDDVDGSGNIIGSSAYIWYGDSWRRIMLGTPGPPGPIPIITPSVALVNPATNTSQVVTGGTPLYPTMLFELAVPAGPQGPGAAIAVAPDVDLSTPPVAGDVLGFTGRYTAGTSYPIWVPVSISQLIPSPYSMPENAFTSFSGLSQRAAIGSFTIPAQPFPWTPICWGHIGAFGLELSANPLQIGCEVLMGDPTSGQLIGRGFGNTIGEVNIMPHYSSPTYGSVAITPTNGVAAVPANQAETIYVNLYNDGAIGIYQFSPTDAQVFVQVTPVVPTSLLATAVQFTERVNGRRRVKSERV
jgi:hypothetical protein